MPETIITPSTPWYDTQRFRTVAFWVLAAILLVESVYAVFLRENDFSVHRKVGEQFLDGEPYYHGMFVHYPLGRIMMNSAIAFAPLYLTRAACYILALLALTSCFRTWRRLADDAQVVSVTKTMAAAIFAAFLMIGYLIRDLDDCGLQIFLLFFLTAAMANLAAGNHARVGFWLATAATYKATPIIFLPYLVWKRQWRAATWMAVFIGVWACAPMPFVGVEKTVQCHQQWLAHIQRVAAQRKAYPDQIIEPQRTDNLSLIALCARFVETYPPGHLLYVDHPLFFQAGNLPPEQAYVAVQVMMLSLAALLAWRFRRSFQSSAAANGLTAEWAAVSLLVAIVSPLCWKQHLVLSLPALFLIVRTTLAMAPIPRWRIAALGVLGGAFNLSGSFLIGKELSPVVHAAKVDTLAQLALLALVLTLPAAARASSAVPGTIAPKTREQAKAA